MSDFYRRYAALPTAAKLLLILSAAIVPIGLALVWVAQSGIREANAALEDSASDHAQSAARGIESLIARNVLALRIAANGSLVDGPANACARAHRSLAIAPAVAQRFELQDANGQSICSYGYPQSVAGLAPIAPGDIGLRIAGDGQGLIIRVGVIGGMATASLPMDEIRNAAVDPVGTIESIVLRDDRIRMSVIDQADANARRVFRDVPIGNGQLEARIGIRMPRIATSDRLLILLPLVMWITAALVTWLLVTRLLIRPLRRLERAVIHLEPGETANALPSKLGPATEIQQLRDAFARSLARIDDSEREMAAALEGQRRLVREVHHRVKNNLQVIASLLNIHGRSADTPEARAAYAAIGRRVGALSIVHRNHFAEMEESRGIALRPLIAELAAELRGGAPANARDLRIDLDVEGANTTQDVAVAVSFLITEMVEHAMLNRPDEPVEITFRRTSELTARLTLASPVLVPDAEQDGKVQFERIIAGLAKQLRSQLERKLGRYSVDLPVFPAG